MTQTTPTASRIRSAPWRQGVRIKDHLRFVLVIFVTLAAACGDGRSTAEPEQAAATTAAVSSTSRPATEDAPKPDAASEAPDAAEDLPETPAKELPDGSDESESAEPLDAPSDEGAGSPDPSDEDAVTEAVACADGMTLMEEFATDSDDGCRPEVCENGRDDRGECLAVEADHAEEATADAPEEVEPLTWDEYGLEDCIEVSLGVCDRDGVRYCHDTVTGWAECPGQPSGDPCEHDPDDPLSVVGSVLITGQIPEVVLTSGAWTMHVCLSGNDSQTGAPAPFQVALWSPIGEGGWPWPMVVLGPEEAVTDGVWQVPLEVPDVVVDPVQVMPNAEGGGTWTVAFRRTSGGVGAAA